VGIVTGGVTTSRVFPVPLIVPILVGIIRMLRFRVGLLSRRLGFIASRWWLLRWRRLLIVGRLDGATVPPKEETETAEE
jgi:hypothetical protein